MAAHEREQVARWRLGADGEIHLSVAKMNNFALPPFSRLGPKHDE